MEHDFVVSILASMDPSGSVEDLALGTKVPSPTSIHISANIRVLNLVFD